MLIARLVWGAGKVRRGPGPVGAALSSSVLPGIYQVPWIVYQDCLPWAHGLFAVSSAGLLSMLLFPQLGNDISWPD